MFRSTPYNGFENFSDDTGFMSAAGQQRKDVRDSALVNKKIAKHNKGLLVRVKNKIADKKEDIRDRRAERRAAREGKDTASENTSPTPDQNTGSSIPGPSVKVQKELEETLKKEFVPEKDKSADNTLLIAGGIAALFALGVILYKKRAS